MHIDTHDLLQSVLSRLPVHPANTKANNRAIILIRAIPFCGVSKQERRREWNAIIGIGGWKYDPRENRESARSRRTSGCIRTMRGEGNGPVWAVEGHAWKCK